MSDESLIDRLRGQYSLGPFGTRDFSPFIPLIQTEAANRIEALERENAKVKRLLGERADKLGETKAQAAVMRKALEEKLLTKGTQYGLPENCSKWTCECGAFGEFKEDISHLNSCPLRKQL